MCRVLSKKVFGTFRFTRHWQNSLPYKRQTIKANVKFRKVASGNVATYLWRGPQVQISATVDVTLSTTSTAQPPSARIQGKDKQSFSSNVGCGPVPFDGCTFHMSQPPLCLTGARWLYFCDGWFIRPFHSFPLYSTTSTFLNRVCCALVNLAHSQKQRFQSLLWFSSPKIAKDAEKSFLFSYVKCVSRISTYCRHNIKASQI